MTEHRPPNFESLVAIQKRAEALRAEATRAAFVRLGAGIARLWTHIATSLHLPGVKA